MLLLSELSIPFHWWEIHLELVQGNASRSLADSVARFVGQVFVVILSWVRVSPAHRGFPHTSDVYSTEI